MTIYTLEEITSDDVDQPPRTLDKARRKFNTDWRAAYLWIYNKGI